MTRLFAVSAALCATFSACTETTSPASGSQSMAFMTQEELLAAIPGATVYGTSFRDGESRWVQTYSSGGTIAGTWNGEPYRAAWSADGNKWCEQWEDGSGCWAFVKVSDKELRAYKDGTEPVKNS